MKELKEKLMRELMDYAHGELTHSSLDIIDKLAHALKNVCKIELMCEDHPIESEKDYEKEGSEVISELETVLEKLKNM